MIPIKRVHLVAPMAVDWRKMKNSLTIKATRKSQGGILLLEVLISILIFSFGILGLVGLQAVSTQNSASAENRSIAANLANDMVSQMWLLKNFDPASISSDVNAWKTRVVGSSLPNGVGTVTAAGGIVTVSISWKPPYKSGSENSSHYDTQIAQ